MAKSFAQSKGIRGEREIIDMLQPVVTEVYEAAGLEPPKLQRNTLQSDGGGFDIVGLHWLAMEVKRCETLNRSAWTAQCLRQAKPGQVPVLFYKQNHQKWKVMMHSLLVTTGASNLKVWSEIKIEDFMVYFKLRLTEEIKKEMN